MPFNEFPASKEVARVHFNPELAGYLQFSIGVLHPAAVRFAVIRPIPSLGATSG
jgi:hypothetical protein